MLAVAEINAGGGLFGRMVDLAITNAGETDRAAAAAVDWLIGVEEVDAIIGMHPSNVRRAITVRIAGRVPYIYTPQYEGGERSPGVAAIGATDADLLRPTLPWFTDVKRARRFFVVGNDYVWPHVARRTAQGLLGNAGAEVVGEAIIPFCANDHDAVLAAIRCARPDVVLMLLAGAEAARFNRGFAHDGLSAGILRFALGVDQTVLYAGGADASENLYIASTYIASVRSRQNDRFLELYHDGFGEQAVPVSVFGHSCYEAVHLVAGLARAGGSPAGSRMAHRLTVAARCGRVRDVIPPTLMAARPKVHFAAADGLGFRTLTTH